MTKTGKTKVTAAELMATLSTDPEFVARRARAEEERQQREASYRQAEAPLVEELRAAGVVVASVWELVNTASPYPSALPILLDHLQRSYPPAVREGIARALAIREARSGWSVLMRLYRDEREGRVKDGLAVAIAAAATDDVIADAIALARDRSQGPSRVLLLGALERSTDPRARAALADLGDDPDTRKEIRVIQRRLKRAKPNSG